MNGLLLRHQLKELIPVIGVECEFYLNSKVNEHYEIVKHCQNFAKKLNISLAKDFFLFREIKEERGKNQFELVLHHTAEIDNIIKQYNEIIAFIKRLAKQFEITANFLPKIFRDDYGSALQINIHLEDKNGNNLFSKHENKISNELSFSINGLLDGIKNNIDIFIPDKESANRLDNKFKAPDTISWGVINRSVALRIVQSSFGDNKKYIEHRLAGANCNIEKIIESILNAIDQGFQEAATLKYPQIYGNAGDKIYNLEKI